MSTEDPAAARHGISSGRAFTTRCPNAGHNLAQEAPAAFADAILDGGRPPIAERYR